MQWQHRHSVLQVLRCVYVKMLLWSVITLRLHLKQISNLKEAMILSPPFISTSFSVTKIFVVQINNTFPGLFSK